MYHVSAQGVDERMINIYYYYMDSFLFLFSFSFSFAGVFLPCRAHGSLSVSGLLPDGRWSLFTGSLLTFGRSGTRMRIRM